MTKLGTFRIEHVYHTLQLMFFQIKLKQKVYKHTPSHTYCLNLIFFLKNLSLPNEH